MQIGFHILIRDLQKRASRLADVFLAEYRCTQVRIPRSTAHDQVDIKIETVGFERGTIALLHLAHLRTDIAHGFIKGLPIHQVLALGMGGCELNVVVDQSNCCLSKRQISRTHQAQNAVARLFVDAHFAADGDVVHPGAGARIRRQHSALAARIPRQ